MQSKMDKVKVFAIHFKEFQSNCWIKRKMVPNTEENKRNRQSET